MISPFFHVLFNSIITIFVCFSFVLLSRLDPKKHVKVSPENFHIFSFTENEEKIFIISRERKAIFSHDFPNFSPTSSIDSASPHATWKKARVETFFISFSFHFNQSIAQRETDWRINFFLFRGVVKVMNLIFPLHLLPKNLVSFGRLRFLVCLLWIFVSSRNQIDSSFQLSEQTEQRVYMRSGEKNCVKIYRKSYTFIEWWKKNIHTSE